MNTQTDGVYLYGSNGNQAPLVAVTPAPTDPTAPQYQLNNTTNNYTANTPTVTVNNDLNISASMTAGSNTSGTGNFNGFLYQSGTTTLDTYTLIATAAQELQAATSSANAFTATGGYASTMAQINAAVGLTSESVGIASAKLSQISLNGTDLNSTLSAQEQTMSSLTSLNTADAATELTQVQTAYQAALQSGAKILNLSILDYIQ